MDNYVRLSDERLQQMAVSGDSLAEDCLAGRYSRLVRVCARPFFLTGGDSEDLTQEGMLGLLSAIREYDASMNASFKTFAEVCIRRRILSAIKSASRQKHTPLNEGVPLEDTLHREMQSSKAHPAFDLRRMTEEQVLARERADEFFHAYSRCLSPLEARILDLYLDGLSYHAIAEECGRDEKAVDNAVQRIRRKLAREISFGDISES